MGKRSTGKTLDLEAEPVVGSSAETTSHHEEIDGGYAMKILKMKARLTTLEINVECMARAHFKHCWKTKNLEEEIYRMQQELKKAVSECYSTADLLAELMKSNNDENVSELEDSVKDLRAQVRDQDDTISLLKQAIVGGSG